MALDVSPHCPLLPCPTCQACRALPHNLHACTCQLSIPAAQAHWTGCSCRIRPIRSAGRAARCPTTALRGRGAACRK